MVRAPKIKRTYPNPPRKENQSRLQQAFYRAREMFGGGGAIKAIAPALHLCRNTQKKYLVLPKPPIKKPFSGVNVSTFDSYILERIRNEPGITKAKLIKALKVKGYPEEVAAWLMYTGTGMLKQNPWVSPAQTP